MHRTIIFGLFFAMAFACSTVSWAQRGGTGIQFQDPVVDIPKPTVIRRVSPNFGDRPTDGVVDSIVMHTTEVSLQQTLEIFDSSASQVSAHFTIAPNGDIYQHVGTNRRAWHATYYNSRSIGIEMVGFAHDPSTWNDQNLESLTELMAWIVTAYPDIPIERPLGDAYDFDNNTFDAPGILAHGQVQPWNRTDPGPYFPWNNVLAETAAKAVPEPATFGVAILALSGALRRRPRRV